MMTNDVVIDTLMQRRTGSAFPSMLVLLTANWMRRYSTTNF